MIIIIVQCSVAILFHKGFPVLERFESVTFILALIIFAGRGGSARVFHEAGLYNAHDVVSALTAFYALTATAYTA